jgi:hypothetical protein
LNLDDVLIFALTEPLSYTKWRSSARNLLKENKGTLANATFNEHHKRLLEAKIVVSKKINGREKEFRINDFGHEKYISLKNGEAIDGILKDSERILKVFSSNPSGEKPSWLDDSWASEAPIYKIKFLLSFQQHLSLVTNGRKLPKIHHSTIKENIKKCNLAIKNYFTAYRKLDKDHYDRIFASLFNHTLDDVLDDKLYPTFWKTAQEKQNRKSKK